MKAAFRILIMRFAIAGIVSINRDVRNGRFPQPDYTIGPYRFWKLSTLIRARERRIADSAQKPQRCDKYSLMPRPMLVLGNAKNAKPLPLPETKAPGPQGSRAF